MKAKLVVEGKEFDIEILDPKLQEIITPKKKAGYEPVGKNEYYWIVNEKSELEYVQECGDDDDALFYSTANYYESEFVAAQNARADTLMRQLTLTTNTVRKISLQSPTRSTHSSTVCSKAFQQDYYRTCGLQEYPVHHPHQVLQT